MGAEVSSVSALCHPLSCAIDQEKERYTHHNGIQQSTTGVGGIRLSAGQGDKAYFVRVERKVFSVPLWSARPRDSLYMGKLKLTSSPMSSLLAGL